MEVSQVVLEGGKEARKEVNEEERGNGREGGRLVAIREGKITLGRQVGGEGGRKDGSEVQD